MTPKNKAKSKGGDKTAKERAAGDLSAQRILGERGTTLGSSATTGKKKGKGKAKAKAKGKAKGSAAEPRQLVAVIDIGSSALRLVVAEITGPEQWRVLEAANKPVAIGREVFTEGFISRDSIVQCLQILGGFLEIMNAYDVTKENLRAIATSALREAKNKDIFLDRVKIRTGIDVEVIEGIEANQLTYTAVRHAMQGENPRMHASNSIVMEVGGGSTEVMLLQRGRIVTAHTLHIGTIRMQPLIRQGSGYGSFAETFLRQNTRGTLDVLAADYPRPLHTIRQFIAVGGDARLAALHVGKAVGPDCAAIEMDAFVQFARRLERLTIDETVSHLDIHYRDAETLLPALLVYLVFAEVTGAERILVPNVSIRDGLLVDMSTDRSDRVRDEFRRQVLASAWSIGNKFHNEEGHARAVVDFSMQLFDDLLAEHGLGPHHRLLLEVAAILHDVGTYINGNAHHKHGQYIIENADIFGLNRADVNIISNVVRYHRKSIPMPTHEQYMQLSEQDRLVVLKLAALLRVADALDRGHTRRLHRVEYQVLGDALHIRCPNSGDLSLERLSLQMKGELFEDVFGLQIKLC